MALGRVIALRRTMRSDKPTQSPGKLQRGLTFLGRHSLATYLIHQPLLIACVYLFSLVFPAPQASPEVENGRFFSSCMSTCEPDNGETFCVSYCDCALNGFIENGMLAGSKLPAGEIESRRDAIIRECTRQTIEGTNDR